VLDKPLIQTLPHPDKIHRRLGDALREVQMLRRLLRLAELAQGYRECDEAAKHKGRHP
jgi:hypothetical protein